MAGCLLPAGYIIGIGTLLSEDSQDLQDKFVLPNHRGGVGWGWGGGGHGSHWVVV